MTTPTLKQNSNTCPLCRALALPPPCKGHAGGSGGAGGEKNDIASEKPRDVPIEAKKNTVSDYLLSTFNHNLLKLNVNHLAININKLTANIILKLPFNLPKDQHKSAHALLFAIKKEFDEFKEELGSKGLGLQSKIDKDGLTLMIPNAKHFIEFIKRLEVKNLLPGLEQDNSEEKKILSLTFAISNYHKRSKAERY